MKNNAQQDLFYVANNFWMNCDGCISINKSFKDLKIIERKKKELMTVCSLKWLIHRLIHFSVDFFLGQRAGHSKQVIRKSQFIQEL